MTEEPTKETLVVVTKLGDASLTQLTHQLKYWGVEYRLVDWDTRQNEEIREIIKGM